MQHLSRPYVSYPTPRLWGGSTLSGTTGCNEKLVSRQQPRVQSSDIGGVTLGDTSLRVQFYDPVGQPTSGVVHKEDKMGSMKSVSLLSLTFDFFQLIDSLNIQVLAIHFPGVSNAIAVPDPTRQTNLPRNGIYTNNFQVDLPTI